MTLRISAKVYVAHETGLEVKGGMSLTVLVTQLNWGEIFVFVLGGFFFLYVLSSNPRNGLIKNEIKKI